MHRAYVNIVKMEKGKQVGDKKIVIETLLQCTCLARLVSGFTYPHIAWEVCDRHPTKRDGQLHYE